MHSRFKRRSRFTAATMLVVVVASAYSNQILLLPTICLCSPLTYSSSILADEMGLGKTIQVGAKSISLTSAILSICLISVLPSGRWIVAVFTSSTCSGTVSRGCSPFHAAQLEARARPLDDATQRSVPRLQRGARCTAATRGPCAFCRA